jgi:hypothetical protein
VNGNGTPVLDSRSTQDFYAELTAAQTAFVPELPPMPAGTVAAMMQIVARFSSIVVQRLNQAPDLDKLAFLEMLGISLIPAQPARVPLVFAPLPLTGDGQIPAGTRAGATLPGQSAPTVFETENNIAMTAAQLTQVVSLWPDQDGYIDHSSDFGGGRQFTLFQNPSPVNHVLYLSQQTLLAFKGKSTVEVSFALATPGSKAVTWRWEFWDGQTWQSFVDFNLAGTTASQDGTAGLTKSGTVTLQAECGDSAATSVGNISNYWIRGRLTAPLPPDPTRTFAVASQISLRTTIDRALTHGIGSCSVPAQIDAAYAGSTTLDLTKIFYPLGKAPGTDAAFYFVSQEVFSKPGANVTLCFDRATTPEQSGDQAGSQYAVNVTQAEQDLVTAVTQVANAAIDTYQIFIDVFPGSGDTVIQNAIANLKTALSGFNSLSALPQLTSAFNALVSRGISGTENVNVGDFETDWDADRNSVSSAFNALTSLTAISAAAAVGVNPPVLPPPRLVWEYYNGTEWLILVGPVADPATNLMASGEITFTVPPDISPFMINGSPALGMRARLVSGSYNLLTVVTWTDPGSGTNYIPVIQPRPPALNDMAIGYTYQSAWLPPDQSLTWTISQWRAILRLLPALR